MTTTIKTWEENCLQAEFDLVEERVYGRIECVPSHTIPQLSEVTIPTLFDWAYHNETLNSVDRNNLVAVLASKQADYGHGNIMEYGVEGVMVRLSDKLARIRNLVKRGVDPENESLKDSYLDICGYCVIWQMLQNGTFESQLAADVVSQETFDPEETFATTEFVGYYVGADGKSQMPVYRVVPVSRAEIRFA